jgi:hypothetical protein
MSLKELSTKRPTLDDVTRAMDGLKTADPRVAAIVGSTYLEDVTHLSIVTKTVELKKEDEDRLYVGAAPLSSFSAKILVAYALGLIGPKARHDLDKIREIRNVFAHAKIDVSFDTPAVVNAINGMHFKALALDWSSLKTQEKFSLIVRLLQIYLISTWGPATPDTTEIRNFDPPAPIRQVPSAGK